MRVTASKKQINECSILKNDVLFTPSSETADDIAHSKVIEETLKNTLFSYHLIRYRPNQNIFYSLFPDYLFDTNHFKKQASLLAKGVQRFVLGKPEFESLNVIFPNINEQTKITKTFRYIDSLITLHQWECNFWKFRNFVFDFLKFSTRFFKKIQKYTHTWEQEKLGNLTDFIVGKSFKGYIKNSGKYIVMDMGSIGRDGDRIENKYTDVKRDLLRKGDLVMCKDDIGGGQIIGRTCYIPDDNKYVLGDHAYKLSISNNDSLFFHYSINSPFFNLKMRVNAVGSAQLGLNVTTLKKQLTNFPNYQESNKISSLFSNLDSLITLHQWECNFWKFRNFVFDFLKFSTRFFKKIQKYTHTWEQEKLEDISYFINGLTGVSKSDFNIGNDLYLDYMNIFTNTFAKLEFSKKYNQRKSQNYINYKDVLLTISSESPEEVATSSVILQKPNKNIAFNSFCVCVRFRNPEFWNEKYIGYFFRSKIFREQANRIAQGISRFNINQENLKKCIYLYPLEISEQEKIGNLLFILDSLITLHQRGYKWREK
ncbi:restriction endonuclease subunit S [Mycoplasma capricolum]|uniref:restriction endonuclease subunit S n=1 Tax=Mycoplasma capricolum TaxID=2095 RepID=UPI002FDE40C5